MSHWTTDKKHVKHFESKVENQGYSLDEALAALGVAAITDLQGSIGEALNRLSQVKKQSERQRHITSAPADSLELVPIGGALSEIYGDPKQLKAIAHRARRFFPWATIKGKPSDLDNIQVLATIQYAHIIGANPANEVHPWYDPKNNVFIIMPHYSYNIRKAREVDPRLMFWCEWMAADDPSLVDGDIGVTCHVRTGPQQDMYIAMVRAGVNHKIADKQTHYSAVGIVSAEDRTAKNGKPKAPPRGWTWRQRAETRAITNALKRAVGTVAIADQARSRFQALGMPNGGELYLDAETTVELAIGEIIDHDPVSDSPAPVVPEEPLEDETVEDAVTEEQPNGKPIRFWLDETVETIIDHELAIDPQDAIYMLNLSIDLDPNTGLGIILQWASLYADARKDGMESETDAAKKANDWLRTAKFGPQPRSWDEPPVKILIDNSVAKNAKHAVAILNMSRLDPQDDLTIILRWGQLYREARDSQAEKTEAAGIANAWLADLAKEMPQGDGEQDEPA